MDVGAAGVRLVEAFRFAARAKWGGHGVHSPFAYELATRVLPHRDEAPLLAIEALRRLLCRDHSPLEIDDLGAGPAGAGGGTRVRTVAALARTGARRYHTGALLTRLVRHLAPRHPLELGTQLGISALYQAAALPKGVTLISVEGSSVVAERARRHLAERRAPVHVHTADFDSFLASTPGPYDWVLLDGHHTEAATLRYVERLLPQLLPGACVVLDDIRWSAGMTRAWRQLCADSRISVSVDLFSIGLLFVGRPQAREHFSLWPGVRIFTGY